MVDRLEEGQVSRLKQTTWRRWRFVHAATTHGERWRIRVLLSAESIPAGASMAPRSPRPSSSPPCWYPPDLRRRSRAPRLHRASGEDQYFAVGSTSEVAMTLSLHRCRWTPGS